MTGYKPAVLQSRPIILGQQLPPDQLPPDIMMSNFTGVPGILETLLVLGVVSASAFVGINTGLKSKNNLMKTAGWVGGVGSALIGLLYLGTKTSLVQEVGLPSVRVSPI